MPTKARRARASLHESTAFTELLKLLNRRGSYGDPMWDRFRQERIEDLEYIRRHDRTALPPVDAHVRSQIALLQSVGLLPNDLGTRVQDTGHAGERIPSGVELQRHFANLEISEGELMSEAERAWKHGDQAASEEAAKKAH